MSRAQLYEREAGKRKKRDEGVVGIRIPPLTAIFRSDRLFSPAENANLRADWKRGRSEGAIGRAAGGLLARRVGRFCASAERTGRRTAKIR